MRVALPFKLRHAPEPHRILACARRASYMRAAIYIAQPLEHRPHLDPVLTQSGLWAPPKAPSAASVLPMPSRQPLASTHSSSELAGLYVLS